MKSRFNRAVKSLNLAMTVAPLTLFLHRLSIVPHCSPEELGGDSKSTPTAHTPQLAGSYTKVGKPWIGQF